MLAISVVCSRCGGKIRRVVDQDCPPSYVRCICGARFSLALEDEPQPDCLAFEDDDPTGLLDRAEEAYLEMM